MRKQLSKITSDALARRYRRKLSIRKKINGSEECPRICATKSNKHLVVQVINDVTSTTLFSVQTFGKEAVKAAGCNRESAKVIGATVAAKLKAANISKAVFDRSGYKYTGVVATLVDSIREGGIQV